MPGCFHLCSHREETISLLRVSFSLQVVSKNMTERQEGGKGDLNDHVMLQFFIVVSEKRLTTLHHFKSFFILILICNLIFNF